MAARGRPRPAPPRADDAAHRWVLLGDDSALSAALAEQVAARGGEVVTVVPGSGSGQDGRRVTLDPRAADRYGAALEAAGAAPDVPLRVVSLWGGAASRGACPPLGEVAGLAAALSTRTGPVEVCLVTRGALEITGSERLDPWAALTVGAAGALRAETEPGTVTVRLIDIELPTAGRGPDACVRDDLCGGPPYGDGYGGFSYEGLRGDAYGAPRMGTCMVTRTETLRTGSGRTGTCTTTRTGALRGALRTETRTEAPRTETRTGPPRTATRVAAARTPTAAAPPTPALRAPRPPAPPEARTPPSPVRPPSTPSNAQGRPPT
ncbi:hypothetical protein GPA10_21555 [Streptomyces sp. p1417]|uniref:Uncharacterized protein n=1 Tax=Streptomyces typhae TaxID=2681492 RepID=A0A6L6X0E8_9ACTN|nr:hypothetical protein [Streptomyces typhae]MVO87278.1 hypothetical protein [Streptomyces typhae]